MTFPAQKISEIFSWNEYKEWPEGERWQIIDGQAVLYASRSAYLGAPDLVIEVTSPSNSVYGQKAEAGVVRVLWSRSLSWILRS